MTAGLLFLTGLSGGTINALTIWTILCYVVNGGALLTLPAALVVAVLAEEIRRLLREERANSPDNSTPILA